MSRLDKLRKTLKHAFAVENPVIEMDELSENERNIVYKLAEKTVRFGLEIPAIMFLESVRPMNYIGSQGLAFFEPVVKGLFDWREYTEFRLFLEKRGSVELMIRAIEETQAEAQRQSAEKKKKPAPSDSD